MNSFETDMKRAVLSYGFSGAVLLMLAVLELSGFGSRAYMVCVPLACTFPYAGAWITDYKSGFIKEWLPRTGVNAYIMGKLFACAISGGLVGIIPVYIFAWLRDKSLTDNVNMPLLFASGALWAIVASTLAALSNSRYVAYGGSFVVFYLLVILNERYFRGLYCLCPEEWIVPVHIWYFGGQGVLMLVIGMCVVFMCINYEILRRCIANA